MEGIEFKNKVLRINKKDPVIFDEKYKFYLRDGIKPGNILTIKQLDPKT
jgi:hypothetical protein